MQFSSYSDVEVDDGDAEKIMTFMQDILRSTECLLHEIKNWIKLLESQCRGIPAPAATGKTRWRA